MKELFDHYKKYIYVLIIPYILLMFVLVTPMDIIRQDKTYGITNPGGMTEVEDLIQIDYNQDKEITGSISTIYVLSLSRPTYFQFMLSTFTLTADNYIYDTYTSAEDHEQSVAQSFLSKDISVDSAIIVAFTKAAETNPDINVDYFTKEIVYGVYTDKEDLDSITLGDEFVSMVGDNDYLVTSYLEMSLYSQESDSYLFTFNNEETGEYSLTIQKDTESNKFGLTFTTIHVLDEETLYPTYTISDTNIGGPSGGLLQTLSIYNQLITEDITKGLQIAGTGTIYYNYEEEEWLAGYIGGVEQKVITAYSGGADIMFVPYLADVSYDNYILALEACEKFGINPEGFLVPVESFQDVIDYLEAYDG